MSFVKEKTNDKMLKMKAAATTQASATECRALWSHLPNFQGFSGASLNPQNAGPQRNPLPATPNCPFPWQLSSGDFSRGNLRVETPSHEAPGRLEPRDVEGALTHLTLSAIHGSPWERQQTQGQGRNTESTLPALCFLLSLPLLHVNAPDKVLF